MTSFGVQRCQPSRGRRTCRRRAVTLIGCVGDDDAGAAYLRHLERESINIDCIRRSEVATGSAFIAVDDKGENCIIVNPGANHALTPDDIDGHAR